MQEYILEPTAYVMLCQALKTAEGSRPFGSRNGSDLLPGTETEKKITFAERKLGL